MPLSFSFALVTARIACVSFPSRFGGGGQYIVPTATVRDVEAVFACGTEDSLLRFGELPALLAFKLGDDLVGLVFPLAAQPHVEHQRQGVVLIILPSDLAAQDVGRTPEMGFELLGQSHSVPIGSSVAPIQ